MTLTPERLAHARRLLALSAALEPRNAEIGKPSEEPGVEILPRENPVPERAPRKQPVKEPEKTPA